MRLYSAEPEEGFIQVRPGRYVRVLPADQVANFAYVRTTCTWQDEPFVVLGEADGWLRRGVHRRQGPVARTLGLEEFDFGVYQGWAPLAEVRDLTEYST